jgi:hypothetical protein
MRKSGAIGSRDVELPVDRSFVIHYNQSFSIGSALYRIEDASGQGYLDPDTQNARKADLDEPISLLHSEQKSRTWYFESAD